jgi:hypothetical protein
MRSSTHYLLIEWITRCLWFRGLRDEPWRGAPLRGPRWRRGPSHRCRAGNTPARPRLVRFRRASLRRTSFRQQRSARSQSGTRSVWPIDCAALLPPCHRASTFLSHLASSRIGDTYRGPMSVSFGPSYRGPVWGVTRGPQRPDRMLRDLDRRARASCRPRASR